VIENKSFESTDCLKADSEGVWQSYGWWLPQQEVWVGGGMKCWHCQILYLGQVLWCAVWKHKFQEYFWSTPLTRIYIDVAGSCVLPLLFLRSLRIVSGCHIINICGGHQVLINWIHGVSSTYRFNHSKLLTYLSYEYGSFSNI